MDTYNPEGEMFCKGKPEVLGGKWYRAAEVDKEIERLKEIIEAQDQLLVAYRLNDRNRASKALDKLETLKEE